MGAAGITILSIRRGCRRGGFPSPWETTNHHIKNPGREKGTPNGVFRNNPNFTSMGTERRAKRKAFGQLAMAPAPPKDAKLTGAVTPDAKVSWSAEEDLQRAGFEILWRETSDPRWQVYDFAASPGETILKGVSTDNHFFAIRAAGKNGARSIAVPTEMERRPAPLPAREQ